MKSIETNLSSLNTPPAPKELISPIVEPPKKLKSQNPDTSQLQGKKVSSPLPRKQAGTKVSLRQESETNTSPASEAQSQDKHSPMVPGQKHKNDRTAFEPLLTESNQPIQYPSLFPPENDLSIPHSEQDIMSLTSEKGNKLKATKINRPTGFSLKKSLQQIKTGKDSVTMELPEHQHFQSLRTAAQDLSSKSDKTIVSQVEEIQKLLKKKLSQKNHRPQGKPGV